MTSITVVGCGYLGAVHAVCLARSGHEVLGVDSDAAKVAALRSGDAPFYEPDFAELLQECLLAGNLRFTGDMSHARGHRVHFLCVGTPQQRHGPEADLAQLESALEALLAQLAPGDLVVGKSTVPVGTAERLAQSVRAAQPDALLAWNPEFLREGTAVADTLRPDRIVYGLPPGPARGAARDLLDQVYAAQLRDRIPVVVTDYRTAEMVKLAANSFLAARISFVNAMAQVCELNGASTPDLVDALGHDARIGRHFLTPGLGFGGSCLPKDVRALMASAEHLGATGAAALLHDVDAINGARRERMITLAAELLDSSLDGRRIAILGAAFKPNSDDVRDSPALDVAARLRRRGASVVVTDPRALTNARRECPSLEYADSAEEAGRGAELVMVLTDWDEYRALDPVALGEVVTCRSVVDGRHALDPEKWESAGWACRS